MILAAESATALAAVSSGLWAIGVADPWGVIAGEVDRLQAFRRGIVLVVLRALDTELRLISREEGNSLRNDGVQEICLSEVLVDRVLGFEAVG